MTEKLKRVRVTVNKRRVVVPEVVWTWLELRGALGTPRGEGILLILRQGKLDNTLMTRRHCREGWVFMDGDVYDNVAFDPGIEYVDLPEEDEAA